MLQAAQALQSAMENLGAQLPQIPGLQPPQQQQQQQGEGEEEEEEEGVCGSA